MTEETKKKVAILPSQFEHSAFARQDITITAEGSQSPEDFMNPNAYSSIAQKIQPRDKITVLHESMTWALELIVVSTARHWVKVAKTNYTDIAKELESVKAPEAADEPFKVEHRGKGGWCVIRKSDNEKIISGLGTQEEAIKQLSDYQKALGQ